MTNNEPIRPGSTRSLAGEGMPIPSSESQQADKKGGSSQVKYGAMEVMFDVKDFPIGFDTAAVEQAETTARSQLWESRADTTLLAADEARVSDLLRMLAATKGGFREDAVKGQLRDGWMRGALHIAAESRVVEQSLATVSEDEENVVGALMAHGAVVDDRDVWACTPLHLAVRFEAQHLRLSWALFVALELIFRSIAQCRKLHELAVAQLLDYGADIDTPNTQGVTPMDELTRVEERAAEASTVSRFEDN